MLPASFHELHWRQTFVVVATVVVFYGLAAYSPPTERLLLVTSGTAALVLVAVITSRLRGKPAGREPVMASFGSFCLVFFTLAMAAPWRGLLPAVSGVVACLACQVLWAARRYPPRKKDVRPFRETWSSYVAFGLFAASALSLLVGIVALFRVLSGVPTLQGRLYFRIVAGYVVGGVGAATIAAACRPLLRSAVGVVFVGVVAGGAAYGAIMPVVALARPEAELSRALGVGIALTCGVLVGAPLALAFAYNDTKAHAV